MPVRKQFALLLAAMPLLGMLGGQALAQQTAPNMQPAPIMPLASRSLLLDITLAGERLVAAGERGIILYSDDSGGHWAQASVSTSQMLTGVFFADAQHGWAVGHDGLIIASDDGGANWHQQRDGLEIQRRANLKRRSKAREQIVRLEQQLDKAGEENRADIEADLEEAQIELEDAQLTLDEALFTSPLMDVWFEDGATGWAVGAFGTLISTGDGGDHWTNQQTLLDNPDEFHLNTITGDSEGRVFIAGEGGVMFRSEDSGKTWQKLPTFYEGSWFGAVYSAKHSTLMICGLRGNLYRSSDFGTTWEKISTGDNNTLAGGNASKDGDIVLVGGEGAVLSSIDGGHTFAQTRTPDRLSLSSGISHGGWTIVVGQGGVRIETGSNDHG